MTSNHETGMTDGNSDVILLFPRDDRQMLDWILVLSAVGVPHQPRRAEGRRSIAVPTDNGQRASREIAAFERENAHWPPPPPGMPVKTQPSGWSAAWVGVLLSVIYLVFGPFHRGSAVLAGAAMSGRQVADGEWWRLLTSLGVHADLSHLAANLISLLAFGATAVTLFGGGLTWAGVLLASVMANALGIPGSGRDLSGMVSFGASTAVFALLGMLVGQRITLAFRNHESRARPAPVNFPTIRKRLWRPIGAAAAIFAMLGAAPHTNVAAHFRGLVCGTAIGALIQLAGPHKVPPLAQRLLEMLAFAIFMYAWRRVLLASIFLGST